MLPLPLKLTVLNHPFFFPEANIHLSNCHSTSFLENGKLRLFSTTPILIHVDFNDRRAVGNLSSGPLSLVAVNRLEFLL